jgi:transcriptional regulator with XRE-family HTH domain
LFKYQLAYIINPYYTWMFIYINNELRLKQKVRERFMNEDLGGRLKTARQKAGLTQLQVSESVEGLSQPAYSDLEKGKSKATTKIVELATLLNVSPTWLSNGSKLPMDSGSDPTSEAALFKRLNQKPKKVPIITRAKMGDFGYWHEQENSVSSEYGSICAQGVSDDAYAIECSGMSMYPVVRAGWVLIFEPNQSTHAGEFVHIGLKNGERMIKELISNSNEVLNILCIAGNKRTAYDMDEVEFINAFRSMHPPSSIIRD